METEKRRRFIINFLYAAIILGIVIFICRYALGALAPFIIALLVSLLLKPLIRFLREKCHIHKAVASIVVVILFYALIAFLLAVIGIRLFAAGKALVLATPEYFNTRIEPFVMNVFDALERFAERLDPNVAAAYDVISSNLMQTIEDAIVTASKWLGGRITNIAVGTPGFLLNVLITVIATLFLSMDWAVLREFVLRQCSDKTQRLLFEIRTHLGLTLWRYTKSYALILLITFAEICIGLLIIGVKNAVLIAVIIALFDILPVVGSGMVLLPWTIVKLIQGDYLTGLGLGILYIVVIVVRNIMEPKIIGDRVGLHPIVTLLSMVVGTYVFGPIGLLGLPITVALIQSLNEQGVIHLFKRKPRHPSEETPPTEETPPAGESAAPSEAPHGEPVEPKPSEDLGE